MWAGNCMLQKLLKELEVAGNPEQAEILQRFFKTGPGEYGEGDIFFGIKSKQIHDIAKNIMGLVCQKLKNC